MPPADEYDYEARLAALTRVYVAALPDKQADLERLWAACADAATDEAWLALRTLAHRLSGSAPNYGFEALGAAARALDTRLGGKTACRDRGLLAPLVAALREALAAAKPAG
ncbi:MAG: Hpt domain-containing protein [Xanthomonadaceae bacterium]|nr:Hpt domain-containing protein [Xanthomonadaceae bacterium]MDE1957670.1 Hpt domain-containing protein [Xanthomonadaceae bacterium]MDE2177594.1 Hpt domain-containing protein [Xanthomonadaceae bacterium]MDE2245987.1 Hpt domain-containing protein [Xanthomonadaceae bacterium]